MQEQEVLTECLHTAILLPFQMYVMLSTAALYKERIFRRNYCSGICRPEALEIIKRQEERGAYAIIEIDPALCS